MTVFSDKDIVIDVMTEPTEHVMFDLPGAKPISIKITELAVRVTTAPPPDGYGLSFLRVGPFYVMASISKWE